MRESYDVDVCEVLRELRELCVGTVDAVYVTEGGKNL